ncbi:MAG: bifunctional diguanylate cyclase/phosphodiesterase [Pseudomonadota bacterium]|nr:bifunctional diguanylate cyclase/phosphodiesterase [Pseudomonadota bacterium]
MQAIPPRGRRKAPIAAIPSAGARQSIGHHSVEELIRTAREDYLEALPIPAALVCENQYGAIYIDTANEQFCRIAGSDGALFGSGPIAEALAEFLAGTQPARQFESNDGRGIGGRHFTVRFARLKPRPESQNRCLVSFIDMTAQVETENSLRCEMLRDSLTGLPNRLAFNERVEEILESESFREGANAVVVVDVTRFSRVNESMGAIAGDELLISFARRLFSALRSGDILGRTGGDEFGILMRLDRGIEDALELAHRVQTVLSTPFRLSDVEIRVDCSIGCAMLTRNVELAEEVLRNAQLALKRSKATGQAQVYEPGQAQAARRRFSLETELRRAIERDQLSLAYQPLIDLSTGAVAGFEALARWPHEDGDPISPAEFIPVAEESGLILSLGRWALDAAARTLAAWEAQLGRPLPIHMSVNVSPIQIARDDLASTVAAVLRATGLPGHRLTLELTESAIIGDPEGARRVLEDLKALDTRIAVDDFGTGYTSMAYLQRLPIDILKIDRSFVTGMLGDRDSGAIVLAILSLAGALGMETTAEGIESGDLGRALTELGCSHGQGFYFSRPLDPASVLDYWLARSTPSR